MRNKATVTALLVIFTLICGFNLFYTYQAFDYESGMGEKDMATLLQDESYKTAKRNAFSLGLDLQGGLFITMEVGVEDILRKYAGSSIDATFEEALAAALKDKLTSDRTLSELFAEELRRVYLEKNNTPQAQKIVADGYLLRNYFTSPDQGIDFNSTDDEILEKLNKDTKDAIDNTFTIIRTRVDQFGVASPNIQQEQGTGRIILELPGVQDTARVYRLLSNTAKLEFRETHKRGEIASVVERIDAKVKQLKGLSGGSDEGDGDQGNVEAPAEEENVVEGDDPNAVAMDPAVEGDPAAEEAPSVDPDPAVDPPATDPTDLLNALAGNDPVAADTNETAGVDTSVASALADTAGLSDDEKIARFKEERPFLGLFDVTVPVYTDRPVVGYSMALDTAEINGWLRHPRIKDIVPLDMKFLWEAKSTVQNANGMDLIGLIAIKTNKNDAAPLEGDVITEAYQDYESGSIEPAVFMNMNNEGAKDWANLTKNNKGRSIAIVMDDLVYSYPNVNGMITGGRSQISGSFTVEEAKDLANLLKAGALPVRAEILGNNQIGPTLGEENLQSGLWSFLIAFLITIGFMAFYYSKSGLVANVALIVNLFYILGVSAAFNIVFTLPGLAAVVLTMGMAVDANVLIFERIREEQLAGKSFKAAIQAGFKNAFSSVMDANITTFLTGLILFTFGLGPIKGFAVSLMIGIVTSLISALFITRLILDYFEKRGKGSITFGTKLTLTAFSKANLGMTRRRKTFYMVSGILVALSLVTIFTNGFRTGVDFKGGRQYKIAFNQEISPESIRQPLTDAFEGETPLIRSIGGSDQLLITTSYKYESNDASQEIKDKIVAAIEGVAPGSNPDFKETMFVGPTVADDIKTSAIWSVGFSLLIIFLYILIRFRGVRFSMGAIAALFHDVIIVLGIFSIVGTLDILPFPLELDQAFIAAILTIIGYSINDTVVVFDRIRENFGEMKSSDSKDVFDTSINQTISRTLITSFTTLLTILILLMFAGDVIRPFMFALFVGIIVGTYSSIFVASPIALDLEAATTRKKPEPKGGKSKRS